MTKRMLIDATHAEETRVVVLDGNRLEDFDVETSTKKQLKGNIYLAKVVRVEPSLQAAFVEYGGGRHGFLAFGEIHPDYYQIPVADRERLLRMQVEEARAEEAAEEAADAAAASGHPVEPVPIARLEQPPETFADSGLPEGETGATHGVPVPQSSEDATELDLPIQPEPAAGPEPQMPDLPPEEHPPEQGGMIDTSLSDETVADDSAGPVAEPAAEPSFADTAPDFVDFSTASFPEPEAESPIPETNGSESGNGEIETVVADAAPPETVGGESEGGDDGRERRLPARYLRNYKIQEVIRRRQIMLVQVVKEERGTKGAALTTYISLAGRFSVLMPNSPRGGGISRKITSAADRRRLKEITNELAIPDGMGLIVRTAGANRPKPEIKRDCEYLLRLWDDIRETTMQSVAPALIHEEASLIKRAIRDNYSRDVDEVLVDGEEGWKQARDIMRMLMPAHARKVISWRDNPASNGQPLFASQQVEAQLDAMMSPNVQLRSGGYLVINQTEALVAIDVNSGRSTRERGIEETALRTNLEAADEVARQLRLRDLAGLIVIDFIDMESKKHNLMVERRLKDALKVDRARIQVGQISHFGLMEMSRQRLRPSLAETSFVTCPHCGGAGHVRSTESSAIHVLRGIDEEGAKRRAAEILVHVAPGIAMYILNHKRDRLLDIERRYAMQVVFEGDASLVAPQMKIDRVRPAISVAAVPVSLPEPAPAPVAFAAAPVEDDEDDDVVSEDEAAEAGPAPAAGSEEAEARKRRRRRRRRGGRREDGTLGTTLPGVAELDAEQPDLLLPMAVAPGPTEHEAAPAADPETPAPAADMSAAPAEPGDVPPAQDEEGGERPRRRGRRGGRRRRRDEPAGSGETEMAPEFADPEPSHYIEPAYTGPTPANPFGGTPFDIYDVMEQAEQMPPPLAAIAMPPPLADSPPVEVAPPASAAPEPALPEPALSEPEPEPPIPEPAPPEPPQRSLHLVEPAEPQPEQVPPPEPLIKPVVIDSSAPAPERKRGWWRR